MSLATHDIMFFYDEKQFLLLKLLPCFGTPISLWVDGKPCQLLHLRLWRGLFQDVKARLQLAPFAEDGVGR